jgi:AhpD family alkylhydroperoxidase
MNPRLDITKYMASGLGRAMLNLSREVEGGLERPLLELVKIRASQINGCAYCLDMHTKDARLAGETEQRIYALDAWRETPFFTDRERAALEWTEAVTKLADTHVPDEIHARVAREFDEAELVVLTFAVVVINGWNRLAVSFRAPAGTYQPQAVAISNLPAFWENRERALFRSARSRRMRLLPARALRAHVVFHNGCDGDVIGDRGVDRSSQAE